MLDAYHSPCTRQTWVWFKFVLIWFNSVSGSFDLTQLTTLSVLSVVELIWIDSQTQKLSKILIQFNSKLKKNLLEFWFKLIHDSKNYLEYWFKSIHDSMTLFIPRLLLTLHDLFWALNSTFKPFSAFHSSAFLRNGFRSARDSSRILETWTNSIHNSK